MSLDASFAILMIDYILPAMETRRKGLFVEVPCGKLIHVFHFAILSTSPHGCFQLSPNATGACLEQKEVILGTMSFISKDKPLPTFCSKGV